MVMPKLHSLYSLLISSSQRHLHGMAKALQNQASNLVPIVGNFVRGIHCADLQVCSPCIARVAMVCDFVLGLINDRTA